MVAVRIENRAQLVYLLTEAAELEHEILCCYLFCTFTMKDGVDEGLTTEQLEAVRRWRQKINGVAVQEMIHLATACNLLTAIGGAPQLRRPNLPTSSRAYPPAFRLQLLPFGLQALEAFVQLEKPEALVETAPGGYRAGAVPLDRLGDIFSSERNYQAVGELYRGIQDGFVYLSQKMGEDRLFVGPSAAQTAAPYFDMPGLIAVHNLETALAAIEVIVEQGEGASLDSEQSHYNQFVAIRDECAAMAAADPSFNPARPVVVNPITVAAPDHASDLEVSRIDDPYSMDFCNLVDGSYEVLVQVLARLFVHAEETADDLALLADVGVGLMMDVVSPLGNALTRLPAGPSHPGKCAGPSFRLSRAASVPTRRSSAWVVFGERLQELAAYCRFLQMEPGAPAVLGTVRTTLSSYASRFSGE